MKSTVKPMLAVMHAQPSSVTCMMLVFCGGSEASKCPRVTAEITDARLVSNNGLTMTHASKGRALFAID